MTKARTGGKKETTTKKKTATKKPAVKNTKPEAAPEEDAPATKPNEDTSGKNAEEKAPAKGIKYDEIIFDDVEKRPDVCLCIDGDNYWFPREEIKLNKSAKTVEMPEWLKELKLGK